MPNDQSALFVSATTHIGVLAYVLLPVCTFDACIIQPVGGREINYLLFNYQESCITKRVVLRLPKDE